MSALGVLKGLKQTKQYYKQLVVSVVSNVYRDEPGDTAWAD
jgi:hypothetical protein